MIFYLIFFASGYFGFELSRHPELAAFKIINILGLSFDIVGIVILSYVIYTADKYREFITKWVSTFMMYIMLAGPIGFFVGMMIGSLSQRSLDAVHPYLPVIFLALPSAFFIESFVYAPAFKRFESLESRSKYLGSYFLISGLLLQLYAATLDLLE